MDIKTHKNQDGITLIDLVLTLSILSFLLTAALPSFEKLLNKNKITAEVMQLRSNLQLARSTAITKNKKVTVCPSNNRKDCSKDWSEGYIVFIDNDQNRVFSDNDLLIYNHQTQEESLKIKWRSFGVRTSLQWHETGITNQQNGTFQLCFKDDPELTRALIITKAGRIRLSKDTNGDNIHEGANKKNLTC